ncbi:tRNA dihydrouridine synthase [Peredibacter starrii]|uniref:tRNA-dihydrouridine synthase n=1 Tax=Peredibacter starrii TaxID=28202 RepID=A0AAX4HRM7_9BACT|nr:tRNA-dihydrouridine synthase family protein [Peredibacter starrii]WPU66043.1 tRNA-dihydrouridine synthase family protein [Peredibacter starrii]
MRKLAPVPYGSLFFAPMEGITDDSFRKTIQKLYPEWDVLACDFLRVPSAGKYPNKHLIKHFGKDIFEIPWIQDKTMFQILTSHKAFTVEMVKQVEELQIPWMDMNIGCPSPTVCKNRGGSFLLTDLVSLRGLVRSVRQNYTGRFTCKIRIGYNDTNGFEDSIKMLNDEGVEMITVHGRTRDDMYKAPARWEFIKRAVELSQVPIIGNGDIWKTTDIDRMLKETGCHGVMIARGALKAPWIAQDYRRGYFEPTKEETFAKIKHFFHEYRTLLESENISVRGLLKQSKSVSRFMLEGIEGAEPLRRSLMLSQTVPEFYSIIENLK